MTRNTAERIVHRRTMVAQRIAVRALLLMLAAAASLAFGGVAAAAAVEFGSRGEEAGQLNTIKGVAVDRQTGNVYVVDRSNERVDEFEGGTGKFLRAWGWGVAEEPGSQKAELETCTTTCYSGLRSTGVGVGGMNLPEGIAVDGEVGSEAVYVVEPRNHRVQVFSLEGAFVAMFGGKVNKTTEADLCTATNVSEGDECQPGTAGTGEGEFERLAVGKQENTIAVGALGMVYVGDEGPGEEGRVEKFTAGGVYQSEFAVAGIAESTALAVGGGHVYVTGSEAAGGFPLAKVFQYSEAGVLEGTIGLGISELKHMWLAADAAGNVFADVGYTPPEAKFMRKLLEYGEAREELESLVPPSEEGETATGLALVESAGEVAVGGSDVVRTALLPPPGPVVLSEEAAPEYGAAATISALVNPEGHTGVKYHFEYGTSPSEETATAAGTLGSGFEAETASAHLEALTPNQTYYYHVVVEDGEGHVIEGPPAGEAEHTFEAPPALSIDGLSVSDVTAEGATLEAQVNPLGTDTTCWFEYSTGAGAATKTASVDIGAGHEDVAVRAHVQGLVAGSVYTYTVVAENEHTAEPIAGEPLQFRAEPAAAPLQLPDGRRWEQVSPVAKHTAALEAEPREGGLIEASANGDGITYVSRTTTEAQPEGEPAYEWAQILSRRTGPSAWSSKDIATAHDERWGQARIGELSEYRLFSEDLGFAAVEPMGLTPLSTQTTERTPYLRTESSCEASEGAAGSCYTPLVTGGEAQPEVPPGTEFAGSRGETNGFSGVIVDGGTPSMSAVVLSSEAPLVEGAGEHGLYEWSHGHLGLLSVLPGGTPLSSCRSALGAASKDKFGPSGNDSRNAISSDGSMVIWSEDIGTGCSGHLYLRNVAAEATTQIDTVQEHASGANEADAVYQDAGFDAEGKLAVVFFTDTQQLTEGSTAAEGEPDLYEYDVAGETLIDLTAPVNGGESADVQGAVPGAAQDGSDVYAVAHGVLTETPNARGEQALAGGENLYLLHAGVPGGEPVFIATLAIADHRVWGSQHTGGEQELHPLLGNLISRVSPDGNWLAFMSQRSLTGYDNRDAVSGERDEEAYLYDATTNRVECASCNPSGERPSGVYDVAPLGEGLLVDRPKAWREHWIAAALPGWEALTTSGELALYQPRYLSNGGRLFFDSPEALVPQDVNHTWDVYEYEPPNGGESPSTDSCSGSASTYVESAGGCVSLVSSGSSPDESAFLDASVSGNDAFFLTSAQLTGSDTDTAYDVYDAHACTPSSPCAPESTTTRQPCESVSSCRLSGGAQGGIGTPSSLTFSGKGNLAPPVTSKTGKKSASKTSGKQAGHCRAKAKRIKSRKRRRHALQQCRKAKRASRRDRHRRHHGARSSRRHRGHGASRRDHAHHSRRGG